MGITVEDGFVTICIIERDIAFKLTSKKWAELCLKYNHKTDVCPSYLGSGVDQIALALGTDFVLKICHRKYVYDHCLKVSELDVDIIFPGIEFFKEVAGPYFMVQERGLPMPDEVVDGEWDFRNFLGRVNDLLKANNKLMSKYFKIVFRTDDTKEARLANALRLSKIRHIGDLHRNNFMMRKGGGFAICDLGCMYI